MPYLSAEERSRKIIEAASAIIREEGLGQATTRRIAERADAPLGSLHYTFRNKEELVAGVYELWMETAAQQIASAIPEGCGLEAGVRAVMTGFFDRNAVDKEARAVGIAEWELFVWALRSSPKLRLAAKIYEQYVEICTVALKRAAAGSADPKAIEELAKFICCAIDGSLIKLFALDDVAAARANLDRFMAVALRIARGELA